MTEVSGTDNESVRRPVAVYCGAMATNTTDSTEGRVVLLTGASGGLGPAVARAFAAEGARLALTAISREDGDRLLAALGLPAERAFYTVTDVTDAGQVARWVGEVDARWGRADVLVTVAGGWRGGAVVDTSDEDWDFLMGLNARSVFLAARAVVPVMLRGGGGKIVAIGSRSGLAAPAGQAAYAAAKAALHRLVEALSAELRERNVNVNAVLPSTIDTPANRRAMAGADPAKWVAPDDLAAVIAFLASDRARAIHGALLPVYGLS